MDSLMLQEDGSGLLFRCDSLWGDDSDLLQLLNCDLALDEELPNLLDGAALQPTGCTASVLPAPCSQISSGSSGSGCPGPAILLPTAVCKGPPARRSHSPALPDCPRAPSLPALQGPTTACGTGKWRTVTTTAAPGRICQDGTSQPVLAAPMPSSDATSSDASPASMYVATSAKDMSARPRRATACCKSATRQPLSMSMSDDDDDTDSEDSNDTEEHVPGCDTVTEVQGQSTRPNKRKAPEVDWRAIEDPAERRRQRRLAKNRVTAARSRERKKSQWAEMEEKLNSMETENCSLREMLETVSKDNEALRAQLAAALGGSSTGASAAAAGSAAAAAAKGGKHTEPAVLVLIATLLLLCAFLPNSSGSSNMDQQQQQQQVLGPAMLGAAILLAELLQQLLSTRSGSKSWSSEHGACFDPAYCAKSHTSGLTGNMDALCAIKAEASAELKPGPVVNYGLQVPSVGFSYVLQTVGAMILCLLTVVRSRCSWKGSNEGWNERAIPLRFGWQKTSLMHAPSMRCCLV